ncbi:class I SAM-dependent methyltransferase [Ottowia testudinis]|uniref:Class I SAM-dependent methyltransferase n=1 Tax=Ottowia testudinis TaxID=2816950 RepID=A0A975CFK4_9BURK|nr:class I SAM-dependent methyltransferase [Ottowia testudinis]QTD44171.1 class I SAM-dependent methyltransferase [Ottowia testudinis]
MPQPPAPSPANGAVPSAPVHVPHDPLTGYYKTEDERAGFLREIFDSTAKDYDKVERTMAFGSGPWYRRKALERAGLAPGMTVVDVGFGTGLVAAQAIEIIRQPGLLTGVDPSPAMMGASPLAGRVKLVEGKAERIPLPDASADFISMGYALRHISDLAAAFAEFHRVLKPGGRVCVLEITKPEGALATLGLKAYMRGWVPLAAWLAGAGAQTPRIWRYYWDSIEACAPPPRIMETMHSAGLTDVKRHVELGVFSEYQARKPQ